MNVWLAGLIAGFAATVVMTLMQLPVTKGSAGSTGAIAAKLTRQGAEAPLNKVLGYAIHFAYGTFWGVFFAVGLDAWRGIDAFGLAGFIGWGLALGTALWLVSEAVVTPAVGKTEAMLEAGMKQNAKYGALYLAFHLVFGGVIGGILYWLQVEPTVATVGDSVFATGVAAFLLVLAGGVLWQWRQHRAAASA